MQVFSVNYCIRYFDSLFAICLLFKPLKGGRFQKIIMTGLPIYIMGHRGDARRCAPRNDGGFSRVIASAAKQFLLGTDPRDCFVAALLAMTVDSIN